MIDLGISSYLFGKSADKVLDTIINNLNSKDRIEKKKLIDWLRGFKDELLEQHKENPNFEFVMNFWQTNNVPEEILKIRYSLDSQYKTYEDYKQDLSRRCNKGIRNFSNSLMDELNEFLKNKIQELSKHSQADIAVIKQLIEDSSGADKGDKNILSCESAQNRSGEFTENNAFLNNKKEDVSLPNLKVSPARHLAASIFFGRRFDEVFGVDTTRGIKVYNDIDKIEDYLSQFFQDFNYLTESPVAKVRGAKFEMVSGLVFDDNKYRLSLIGYDDYQFTVTKLVIYNCGEYWKKCFMLEVLDDLASGNESKNNFFIVPRHHPLARNGSLYHRVGELLNESLESSDSSIKNQKYDNIFKELNSASRILEDDVEDMYVNTYK